jgi:hypothetical protein
MRLGRRQTPLSILAVALCACGVLPLPAVEPDPELRDPLSVERVVLAADRQSVEVDFIGGRDFDPDDPCSVAYDGTGEVVDEVLVIGIYAQPHPQPLPPNMGCDAIGFGRSMTLELDEPFAGSVVHDLGGQVLFLEPPAGLAEIGGLPKGWKPLREGNVLGKAAPRWERVWSDGDSMLTLIQAFDGPVHTTGDERQPDVAIDGAIATFYLHRPSGEMVMTWPLDDDEVALVGYLSDFSRAEFIDLAESVFLPSD